MPQPLNPRYARDLPQRARPFVPLPEDDDDFSMVDSVTPTTESEPAVDDGFSAEERDALVKKLYEGPPKCLCCWVEEEPENLVTDLLPPSTNAETHPLVVRYRIHERGTQRVSSIACIGIEHAGARAVLHRVFAGFDDLIPSLRFLIFHAPFRPLFYRWQQLEEAIEAEEDQETKKVLMMLQSLVKIEFRPAFVDAKELTSNGVVSFRFLWTIFTPGDLIYSRTNGADNFFLLQAVRITNTWIILHTLHIDHDGDNFGSHRLLFTLYSFTGTRRITSLEAFPARYLPDFAATQRTLIERGRKFASLVDQGVLYKSYGPKASKKAATAAKGVPGTADTDSTDRPADRRVILDGQNIPQIPVLGALPVEGKVPLSTGLLLQYDQDAPPPGGHQPLPRPKDKDRDRNRDRDISPELRPYRRRAVSPDSFVPLPPRYVPEDERSRTPWHRTKRIVKRSVPVGGNPFTVTNNDSDDDDDVNDDKSVTTETGEKDQSLNDFQLQLCPPKILGFMLQEKTWKSLSVDRIHDIEWNSKPFDSLVLPDGYKDLILAFVESQVKHKHSFGDVICGKGRGLVLLLSGEPGVGKTLTAESVAEKMHAPLYKMDLGEARDAYAMMESNPSRHRHRRGGGRNESESEDSDVDVNGRLAGSIETAFDLASKWGAVLLIDECDMYLEKRSSVSSVRNKVVCRFLQHLEYYPSLLFLTTNRERQLDPAVHSRVHLSINYPALDAGSRAAIWRAFLTREDLPASSVSAAEIGALAEVDINGRKIRNAIQTAHIVARRAGREVNFEDLKRVMRVMEGAEVGKEKSKDKESSCAVGENVKQGKDVEKQDKEVRKPRLVESWDPDGSKEAAIERRLRRFC